MKNYFLFFLAFLVFMSSCKKDNENPPTEPQLIFKFQFDSTQVRLNNIGMPATLPTGHAAQSPVFNAMSAHYIELAPTMFTALGSGKIIYKAEETTAGGSTAIDFSKSRFAGNGEIFYSYPLKNVAPGQYEYLRVSLAYQNFDVKFQVNLPSPIGTQNLSGRLSSFVGFNTYINCYDIKDSTVCENANKQQGYWGFETAYNVLTGSAPAGATTVPNPISATSPIPAGSCVVTGPFASVLNITGNEMQDVIVTVSLSTNKSFEWIDSNSDGIWQPLESESVVDMGLRGMIPSWQ